MFKHLRQLLTWRGRISRGAFLINAFMLSGAFFVLFVFLDTMANRASTWLLYPPFLWATLALSAKRLHDRGQSARWLLVAIIPVLGPLWLFITLACRKGCAGDNAHGADPLREGDYLTVDIHQAGGTR
jgi:uncharacterized membrane protein YhaH (DUF805 family)